MSVAALVDRFAGTAEPEERPVTTPSPFTRGTVPWWTGVPGLDPAIPVDDWAVAARPAAMACAVRVFGADAPYRAGLFRSSPASKWYGWLLKATGPAPAADRRLALRLICDQAGTVDPDQVLQIAEDLLASVLPPR